MATNTEEILMRVGMDSSGLESGTRRLLDGQKKAALSYVDFWKTAMNQREQAEEQASIKSIARERRLAAQLTAIRAQEARQAAAQITGGYVPESMAGGSQLRGGESLVGGKYIFGKDGKLVTSLNSAGARVDQMGSAMDKLGRHAGNMSRVMYEGQVIIHETLSGNFKRAMGSLMILAQNLGPAGLLTLAGTALIAAPSLYKAYKANKAAEDSQTEVDDAVKRAGTGVSRQLAALKKSGRISSVDFGKLTDQMKAATTQEAMLGIMSKVSALAGGKTLDQLEASPELKRLDEQHGRKMLDQSRENEGVQGKLTFDLVQRHILMEQMAQLDKNTIEYKSKQLELDDANKRVSEDKLALQKESLRVAHELTSLRRSIASVNSDKLGLDVEHPTIEMLAGRQFTSRLSALYGAGGQFDLTAGDGPLAGAAQNALLWKNRQMWDIVHGNAVFKYNPVSQQNELVGGQAFSDRQKQIKFENLLSAAGLDTPAMKFDRMNRQLEGLNKQMGDLLTAAQHDGIAIKDTPTS